MTDEPDDEVTADELFAGDAPETPVKKTRAKKAAPVEEDEPRLHPILSNADFRLAQEAARKSIDKERRLAAMQAVKTMELNRLRIEEGLTSGVAEDDALVDILIDLPEWAPNINNNFGQTAYWHGRSYTVSTAVARSLNEQMFRAWRHEDQLDGKSRSQMLHRKRETTISERTGVIRNAPARFDA
jgi:hypothetical protein